MNFKGCCKGLLKACEEEEISGIKCYWWSPERAHQNIELKLTDVKLTIHLQNRAARSS